mmetsp:Transcript_43508/g.92590  ORF Transcript_43508/g.92590 Transcript_43508/m.92590 type:complete len:248 (-) Transcript_43508:49-792(-)
MRRHDVCGSVYRRRYANLSSCARLSSSLSSVRSHSSRLRCLLPSRSVCSLRQSCVNHSPSAKPRLVPSCAASTSSSGGAPTLTQGWEALVMALTACPSPRPHPCGSPRMLPTSRSPRSCSRPGSHRMRSHFRCGGRPHSAHGASSAESDCKPPLASSLHSAIDVSEAGSLQSSSSALPSSLRTTNCSSTRHSRRCNMRSRPSCAASTLARRGCSRAGSIGAVRKAATRHSRHSTLRLYAHSSTTSPR